MISLDNVSAFYDENKVVDSVSLQFRPGRMTGIIGPNGAGKSTLIRAITGIHRSYSGSILYDGRDMEKDRHWIKQHCGYAPEDAELLPYLTGREHLELLASIYRVGSPAERVDFLLDLGGLESAQSQLVLEYSHGMRQKLSLVSAFAGDPEYIILDEALNGLDSVALFRMKRYLTGLLANNRMIVVTSHILSLILEWCDPVIIMNEGRVAAVHTKEEISQLEREKKTTFEEYFVKLVAEK